MKLFYSDTFELPLPAKHRFPMSKYTLLRERLWKTPHVTQHCQLLLPPAATDEQLKLVHNAGYVDAVKSGSLSDLEQRRIGFPWSKKMVERSRRSTGASIAAGQSACEDGIAINLAGGTHHSFPDNGQGYCVFNDVAVAARTLQQQGTIKNALIIDLDVHQGNGTASIAKNDISLFSFSMHCDKNYPFQKTNGDFDIPLPAGTDDSRYLEELDAALQLIDRSFEADMVFYLAGADPFSDDRLGLLDLSKSGLAQRDELVIRYAREKGMPLAIAMAGGYAPNVMDIVDIHFSTVVLALEQFKKERSAGAFQ